MIVDMPQLNGDEKIGDLIEHVARLQKLVQFLLNGKISTDNIKVGSIESESIRAGAIVADKIEAGAVTAEKITVDELSAITANMGKLTSGEIYGAYIATADGVYPRSEMSAADNMIGAYETVDKFAIIDPIGGVGSVPAVILRDATIPITGLFYVDSAAAEINIGSTRSILISTGAGRYTRIDGTVKVNSWGDVVRTDTLQTLQAALNAKANAFGGFSGTVYVATSPGGSPTTPKTFSNGICTSLVL